MTLYLYNCHLKYTFFYFYLHFIAFQLVKFRLYFECCCSIAIVSHVLVKDLPRVFGHVIGYNDTQKRYTHMKKILCIRYSTTKNDVLVY